MGSKGIEVEKQSMAAELGKSEKLLNSVHSAPTSQEQEMLPTHSFAMGQQGNDLKSASIVRIDSLSVETCNSGPNSLSSKKFRSC